MKILSIFLCFVALMTCLAAHSETIDVVVMGYDETIEDYDYSLKPFKTELTRNPDGSYTMADFFNSGCEASFQFNEPGLYQMDFLYMCGNIFEDPQRPGFPYLMTTADYATDSDGYPASDEAYMTCHAYSANGTPTVISRVFTDQTDTMLASYIAGQDRGEMGADYFACICASGFTEEKGYDMWYYLVFQFNEIEIPAGVEEVGSDLLPVEYYDLSGMRIQDPTDGIFIRRQGHKVSKVVIKK